MSYGRIRHRYASAMHPMVQRQHASSRAVATSALSLSSMRLI
ncbi:hypothetical protein [Gordonibacter sp. Marseille-P4307]|nr:hypothetical protein [Gordonibacter sp. Marseille-P4307]